MYIISKFKDFYDSAVGMGIDKSIVYSRTNNKIHYEDVKDLKLINTLHHETNFTYGTPRKLNLPNFHTAKNSVYDSVSLIVIGFCGKFYVGFRFTRKLKNQWGYDSHETETKIIYDIDEVKKELSFEDYYSWKNSKKNRLKNIIAFNEFVNKVNTLDDSEVFFKYNTPIFSIHQGEHTIELNPTLKELDFYKVIATYTAFQEIQMYISGVLGTNEDGHNTSMTEKQKVQQHGFDQKYGFRTRPKG